MSQGNYRQSMNRQIIGLEVNQNPAEFFHFKLSDGGRVHIPPDQVMRMWNSEQERGAASEDKELSYAKGYQRGYQDGKQAIVDAIKNYVPKSKEQS